MKPKTFAGLALDRPHFMGIVNVTPDSFSDGGAFMDPQSAIDHAHRLVMEGATLIDIGGESTRPGAIPVSQAEELARVLPVIEGLKDMAALISIDTQKPAVMQAAVAAGAHIINDVSALTAWPESLAMAASLQVPVILMHKKGTPETMQHNPVYGEVVTEVFHYLQHRIEACKKAGIVQKNICLDVGFGFGKTVEDNVILLKNMEKFHTLGCPLLVGLSRKSFIGALTGKADPLDRLAGTITASLSAAHQGVQLHRVHDVGAIKQAFDVDPALTNV